MCSTHDGYLRRDLDAVVDDLVFRQNIETDLAEIQEVLAEVQKFDPPGVAARTLEECLLIQLRRKEEPTEYTDLAIKTIEKYFDEQVELTSPIDDINGNFSSAEINSGYSFLSENAREINLQRVGEITCEVDEKHATQQFQVNAKITVSRWFKNLDGRQAVTVHWRKTQQGWRIHSSDWKEIP